MPESITIRHSQVSWYWAECGRCGTRSESSRTFSDHLGWRCPKHGPVLTVVPDLPTDHEVAA